MPTYKGLTVHVVHKDHLKSKFVEWGEQQFDSLNTVYCYIQSESNVPFQIYLRPELPFVPAAPQTRSPTSSEIWSKGSIVSDAEQEHEAATSNEGVEEVAKYFEPSAKCSWASPLPTSPNTNEPFGYHLMASLYLDGRRKAERRAIIYINPHHPDFNKPHGTTFMKARWVEQSNGTLVEQGWYFKEVALETLFDRMIICNSDARARGENPTLEAEKLIAALESTRLTADLEGNFKQEQDLGLGQMVIEIRRVVLGKSWKDQNYRPRHKEGEEVKMDTHGDRSISHTTGFQPAKKINHVVPVVTFSPYSRDEIYARFQFFYRSEETLAKFSFAGFNLTSEKRLHTIDNRTMLEPITARFPIQNPTLFTSEKSINFCEDRPNSENSNEHGATHSAFLRNYCSSSILPKLQRKEDQTPFKAPVSSFRQRAIPRIVLESIDQPLNKGFLHTLRGSMRSRARCESLGSHRSRTISSIDNERSSINSPTNERGPGDHMSVDKFHRRGLQNSCSKDQSGCYADVMEPSSLQQQNKLFKHGVPSKQKANRDTINDGIRVALNNNGREICLEKEIPRISSALGKRGRIVNAEELQNSDDINRAKRVAFERPVPEDF